MTGTPRWVTSCLCHFILIPSHRRHIPIRSLLRLRALWLHHNMSLCSICWEPANRHLLFRGTYSFAPCPGCFLEARILPIDKLNLGLHVPPLELTRCVLMAAAPLGVSEPAVVCIFRQQITYRDVASKPIMKSLDGVGPIWVLATLSPATAGWRAPLGVAGLWREVCRLPCVR